MNALICSDRTNQPPPGPFPISHRMPSRSPGFAQSELDFSSLTSSPLMPPPISYDKVEVDEGEFRSSEVTFRGDTEAGFFVVRVRLDGWDCTKNVHGSVEWLIYW